MYHRNLVFLILFLLPLLLSCKVGDVGSSDTALDDSEHIGVKDCVTECTVTAEEIIVSQSCKGQPATGPDFVSDLPDNCDSIEEVEEPSEEEE